jgi:DUF971 family protein
VHTPRQLQIDGGGSVLTITWEDGRRQEIAAAALRSACPCATCGEPSGWSAMQRSLQGATPVTIAGAHLVGSYALGLTFAPDGHATGIFPFDLLGSLGEAYDEVPDQEPSA